MEQWVYRIWTYVHSLSAFTHIYQIPFSCPCHLFIHVTQFFLLSPPRNVIENKYSLSFQPSRVVSTFQQSSAACISDMPCQVSNGAYLDALRLAESFIPYVEVLFGTIDDLEWAFTERGVKGAFLYSFNFVHSRASFLPTSPFLTQGWLMFAKPACFGEKQSNSSPFYPIFRKRERGGWA